MPDFSSQLNSQLKSLPLGDMILNLAQGVAQAQMQLDRVSMNIAQMMAGVADEHRLQIGQRRFSMIELGFLPSFYTFNDVVLEVKMAVSMGAPPKPPAAEGSSKGGGSSPKLPGLFGSLMPGMGPSEPKPTPVDAGYASKYQFSPAGASCVRTRMTVRPAPQGLMHFVEAMRDGERLIREGS